MNNQEFLTVGSKHIKLWKVNGSTVKGTRLDWGKNKSEPILCCEGIGNYYVVGTISGKLYVIRGGFSSFL